MKPGMNCQRIIAGMAAFLLVGFAARAEIKVTVDHNANEQATPQFKFKNVPSPSTNDVATHARFIVVDGSIDDNSGEPGKLHDGKLPTEEDEPEENFFFDAGTEGGRLLVDLGSPIEIRQVNTYSWHPNTRGPQVYKLYASDGGAPDFNLKPKRGTNPEKTGWKLIATVDTRPKAGEGGGQYGVSIANPDGVIGKYRYLLFNITATEDDDDFGNTFYSEIDVVAER